MSSSKRNLDDPDVGSSSQPAKKIKGKLNTISMIIEAIRSEKHHEGSSRQFIKKYLKEQHQYENDNFINRALQGGIEKGQLHSNKTRFKVKGDPEYEEPAEMKVEIEEVKEGTGDPCEAGDNVSIDYIGYLKLKDSKKEFERGKKFQFQVGAGDVIKGMDSGTLGLKLGGSRWVNIPSKLGYGGKGSGPDLPPHSDLRFLITLVALKRQ
jgi:FKBP-type peptidyl-prolyl cis-trans isomerase